MKESTSIDTATEKVILPSLEKLFLSLLTLGLSAFGGPAMLAHIEQM
jgi:chromate transport protein ChrA